MLTLSQLVLFSAASLVLIFTPGPDIIYVMTRGMAQGRKAALAAAAGFALGNLVHTCFAIVGLSALLASSATAFQLVKYAGALYLVYLGVRMLRGGGGITGGTAGQPLRHLVIFRQSIIANVLNPKVAIFFLALFPQFIIGGRGDAPLQMILLGTTFVILTMAGFGLVALGAGRVGDWLQRQPRLADRVGQLAGGVLVGLGLRLAWPEQH
ncbi:MAG TPA: LysE family translocator [Geobacteraceae bacterium]